MYLLLLFFSLSSVLPSQIVFAEQSQNGEISDTVLSSLYLVDSSLQKVGLSINDFTSLNRKDDQFYRDLKEYVNDVENQLTIDKESMEEKEEAKNMANQWNYAFEMAKLNMGRDANATTLEKETAYMYLSHFVDIKTGVLEKVVPEYSNETYFSSWIVNDDRRTYDTYLRGVQRGELIYNTINTVKSLKDSADLLKEAVNLEELDLNALQTAARSYYLYRQAKNNIIDLKEEMSTFADLYNSSSNLRELITALKQSFKLEKYEDYHANNIKNLLLQAVSSVTIGVDSYVLSSLGVMSQELFFMVSKDLIDKYRWISLIQYNGMRVSKRMLRYYGVDW
ncbi:hypothetical protein DHL47_00835 [Streptococcus panodentis]|uniref:Uncharacterized protein n=2 Tax=Streptococcus panodentis TaxID=1581472 RepID=A0ABS5AUF2_9STRE|nr:hypothetical protein [Streptococcus panodentis]